MNLFIITNRKSVLNWTCLVLMILGGSVHGLTQDRPDRSNAPKFARWLVAENTRGVLSTIADDLGGSPFGDMVSYSDGQPQHGTGIPYFYLTTPDPSSRHAWNDHKSSFTISEYPLGTCGKVDPENPACSKIALTGKLNEVEAGSEEASMAEKALFSKHAEMKNWVKDNAFKIYKLDIEEIFFIGLSDGPKSLPVDQYFLPQTAGRWE